MKKIAFRHERKESGHVQVEVGVLTLSSARKDTPPHGVSLHVQDYTRVDVACVERPNDHRPLVEGKARHDEAGWAKNYMIFLSARQNGRFCTPTHPHFSGHFSQFSALASIEKSRGYFAGFGYVPAETSRQLPALWCCVVGV